MHTDVSIGTGAYMVADRAYIRGAAGLNATVWIEDGAGEVRVDDLDGASEVWMDAQVCDVCANSRWEIRKSTISELII